MDKNLEENMADSTLSCADLTDLNALVRDFFRNNDLYLDIPIDIVALVKKLGFKVLAMDLGIIEDGIDGLILVDESSKKIGPFETNKLIIYDRALKNIPETRFVIAHELAHYIHQKRVGRNVVFGEKVRHGSGKDKSKCEDEVRFKIEQKMDYMAAVILVPGESLKNKLKNLNYNSLDELNKGIVIGDLANEYAVSSELMKRRIEEVSC